MTRYQIITDLEFGVRVQNHLGKVSNGPRVHHSLSELRGVLGNVTEGRGRDALQSDLWFLDAEDQQRHGPSIHHCLGQLWL